MTTIVENVEHKVIVDNVTCDVTVTENSFNVELSNQVGPQGIQGIDGKNGQDSNFSNSFEVISSNLSSWDYTLNYTGGALTSIVYTQGANTITKTLNYTSGDLTSIVLSGDTPSGIALTKTLSYTAGDLTGITYT